ncbi:Chitinase A1 [Smittium mucronatum]|uniref:Chitinase A1 n=1 Tax=Smittium mucronatum TaxID=133383 RepID=A0A1R0H467_9FUNG|nr:Chitinase A1 [Smittium mucronatum]
MLDTYQIGDFMAAFAGIKDGKMVSIDSYIDTKKYIDGHEGYMKYITSDTGLRKKNQNLKILISVGGWNGSKDFSTTLSNSHGRKVFLESIVDFIVKYNFDGLELDWEYPVEGGSAGNSRNPKDGENLLSFLTDLRKKFDSRKEKKYEIAIAASANTDIDFSGSFSNSIGHASNLYGGNVSGDKAISTYLQEGVFEKKLVLGVPLYGKVLAIDGKTANKGDCLLGRKTKSLSLTAGYGFPNDVPSLDEINKYISIHHRNLDMISDSASKAVSIYNRESNIWVSYENKCSISAKLKYIKSKNLGGIMFWELTNEQSNSNVDLAGRFFNGK